MNETTIPLVDVLDEVGESGVARVQQSGKHVRLKAFPHWMSGVEARHVAFYLLAAAKKCDGVNFRAEDLP